MALHVEVLCSRSTSTSIAEDRDPCKATAVHPDIFAQLCRCMQGPLQSHSTSASIAEIKDLCAATAVHPDICAQPCRCMQGPSHSHGTSASIVGNRDVCATMPVHAEIFAQPRHSNRRAVPSHVRNFLLCSFVTSQIPKRVPNSMSKRMPVHMTTHIFFKTTLPSKPIVEIMYFFWCQASPAATSKLALQAGTAMETFPLSNSCATSSPMRSRAHRRVLKTARCSALSQPALSASQ
ncbi:hypothetical protein DUNSADRAFT_1469 [Dunaliella salina]|uniref:Encoded protein n=1 Tax=Dunaliella salina TaxID=3046 RepID=A0ABQ7GX31_DUNSA|nr:hypothetical protein DUNSADRAFT_1469 [Dunaliella salina]|eukprot:KAF5839156.1 hypothetical protein DUNSADRAFT_1469 [Dunaliella salina]